MAEDTIFEHTVVKEICIGKIEALVCKDEKMEDGEEALAKKIKTNFVPLLFFRPSEEDEETNQLIKQNYKISDDYSLMVEVLI